MIFGICSIKTGQAAMQAPQVVQDQMASSVMLPSPSRRSAAWPGFHLSSTACPFASRFALMAWMTWRGLSGLPVAAAGQASWQRPHSVQEKQSKRSFQVNCSTLPTPKLLPLGELFPRLGIGLVQALEETVGDGGEDVHVLAVGEEVDEEPGAPRHGATSRLTAKVRRLDGSRRRADWRRRLETGM